MKNLLLFFVPFLFLTTSCGTLPPIVEDVCEITEEICYYANLVCDNFQQNVPAVEKVDQYKKELKIISSSLHRESLIANSLPNDRTNLEHYDFKARLIQIRNELKALAEQTRNDP